MNAMTPHHWMNAGGFCHAEVIHSHMKAVRDRGDYIVGPASDDAARAAIAVIGARLGVAL